MDYYIVPSELHDLQLLYPIDELHPWFHCNQDQLKCNLIPEIWTQHRTRISWPRKLDWDKLINRGYFSCRTQEWSSILLEISSIEQHKPYPDLFVIIQDQGSLPEAKDSNLSDSNIVFGILE